MPWPDDQIENGKIKPWPPKERCPKCGTEEYPSINFRKGKQVVYCPHCDHEEYRAAGDDEFLSLVLAKLGSIRHRACGISGWKPVRIHCHEIKEPNLGH